jgi:hypothetical protein
MHFIELGAKGKSNLAPWALASSSRVCPHIMDELSEQIEMLQNILIAQAIGGGGDDRRYRTLRKEITGNALLKDVAPRFLRTCRTLSEFWQFIKCQYGSYAERRQFLWDSFRPLFERIEGPKAAPPDHSVALALQKFDPDTVHQLWLKAMERRETDPEGAITLARTLLESVCKHILDEHGSAYAPDSDCPPCINWLRSRST